MGKGEFKMVNENLDKLSCLLSQVGLTNSMTFEPAMTALEYLGVLTKIIKEIDKRFDEIPNVPIICGEWADHYVYEPFSIVTYNSDSYMALKKVPQRVQIENTEYWLKVGDFNAKLMTKSTLVLTEQIPEKREPNTFYLKITDKQSNSVIYGIGAKIEEGEGLHG